MLRAPAVLLIAVLAALLATGTVPQAQTLRAAYQPGTTYTPLMIMKHERLVEKHAAALGKPGLEVQWTQFGNGTAMNESLIAGQIDIVAGGVPPFLVLWDRTQGRLGVKAAAALNSTPLYLNTTNPDIRSLRDFSDRDRIAVPAVRTSAPAIILRMAAEQLYGPGGVDRFDPLTVSLSNPDGYLALVSKRSEVNTHFAGLPYAAKELEVSGVRKITTSYDILGGPGTVTVIWTTARFHSAEPIAYRSFLAALEEAMAFVAARPADAARIYQADQNDNATLEEIAGHLASPEVRFSVVPERIMLFADFMARTQMIKTKPARWEELFFPELHGRGGS